MPAAMTTKGVVAGQHRKFVDCRKGLVVRNATKENRKLRSKPFQMDLFCYRRRAKLRQWSSRSSTDLMRMQGGSSHVFRVYDLIVRRP